MIELSLIELEKYANKYFDTMIEKDPKFINNCSDSWIYDAEEWFYDQFDVYIERKLVTDFLNMCRAIWKRHYDELHAYEDYSKIITSGIIKDDILKIKTEIKNAEEFLCSEKYAKHLTFEQLAKRKDNFRKLNIWINGTLYVLKEITDELRLEDPVDYK